MRIRKNAKLSPLWFSHASAPETALQAHVCQLNQSPWDVIPFAQDSNQFEGEYSFTGNASLGDSIGAVESVASMMDAVAAKAEDMVLVANDNNDRVEKKGKVFDQRARMNEFGFEKRERSSCCQKTDGKGWQCRNEAKEGQSLCEHHLTLLRSYNTNNSSSISFRKSPAAAAAAAAAAAGARRARARAAKKGSSSSNPYEFYYYSGFGPLWGRKRGDRSGGGGGDGGKSTTEATKVVVENVNNISITTQSSTPSSSSQFDNEEFDYVDDDDEDDANGDSGKKRMRKPVKARSLKSLM
ncbi:putative lysozyme-like protein [Fagus crenata]